MKKPESSPWKPVDIPVDIAVAVQALIHGKADEFQQRKAMDWIINVAAGTYDMSYRPGQDGERDTVFAEGRRFVGSTIVKASKLNVSRMRSDLHV